MELWDAVPDTVRAGLRPLDHAEAYPPPPPGCDEDPCADDTATRPLRYLDLLAEAAVAGRLCGERERSLKLTRRALRLLDEDPDPLRAAWFWVQRSRLTQALARGDGWEELGTAQELVRGLPPSEVHAEVLERGWDPRRRAFLQAYGEPGLDASTLVIPKVRFLPRRDPRVRDHLAAIRRELGAGPEELVYRYRTPDGLDGDEGAFVACSFWMIQNVALAGDPTEAERLFRLLLRRAGPLGLFAEEIDPRTGDHAGVGGD